MLIAFLLIAAMDVTASSDGETRVESSPLNIVQNAQRGENIAFRSVAKRVAVALVDKANEESALSGPIPYEFINKDNSVACYRQLYDHYINGIKQSYHNIKMIDCMEDSDRNGTFDFRSSASAKRAGPLKSPVLYQRADVFPEYTFNKIDRKVLRFNKFKDQAIELEYIHIDGQVDPKVVSKKKIVNFANSPIRVEFENFIVNIIDVSSNYVKYSIEGI